MVSVSTKTNSNTDQKNIKLTRATAKTIQGLLKVWGEGLANTKITQQENKAY